MIKFLPTTLAVMFAAASPAVAQMDDSATKADTERAVQAYLALWSRDDGIDEKSVTRFYAPRVVYYGKPMSRAQVLADKRSYARAWPVRRYSEVRGSLAARCTAQRTFCKVSADMTWRRVSRASQVSTGRARLSFDFVPADGRRKIARESARLY